MQNTIPQYLIVADILIEHKKQFKKIKEATEFIIEQLEWQGKEFGVDVSDKVKELRRII